MQKCPSLTKFLPYSDNLSVNVSKVDHLVLKLGEAAVPEIFRSQSTFKNSCASTRLQLKRSNYDYYVGVQEKKGGGDDNGNASGN